MELGSMELSRGVHTAQRHITTQIPVESCMLAISLGQGSHISGLTKLHDISMIFPGFSKEFQVYFLNIFNVASNYFWINVYIKISPNQKYIISTVSKGSHTSRLKKFHDISMIFIIFCKIP